MLPASPDCKHEPSLAAGDNFSHHKLLKTTGVVFSSDTLTEAGEGNIYHLVHGGARLQAGTSYPK